MCGTDINQLFTERSGLNLHVVNPQGLKGRTEKVRMVSEEPRRPAIKHWKSETSLTKLEYVLQE